MTVKQQIDQYIAAQPAPKAADLRALDDLILTIAPSCRLWFLDGRNQEGKVVSNPNIGYGSHAIKYANGETRDFYQVGISANTSGLSIYVIGIEDKAFLARAYGARLGKAKITGYCIRFKALKDVNLDVLEEIFRAHMAAAA